MAESDPKPPSEKKKYWSIINEAVKFIATILSIVISTFTLKSDIKQTTSNIDQLRNEVHSQIDTINSTLTSIREHLIAKGIIQPKN